MQLEQIFKPLQDSNYMSSNVITGPQSQHKQQYVVYLEIFPLDWHALSGHHPWSRALGHN